MTTHWYDRLFLRFTGRNPYLYLRPRCWGFVRRLHND